MTILCFFVTVNKFLGKTKKLFLLYIFVGYKIFALKMRNDKREIILSFKYQSFS